MEKKNLTIIKSNREKSLKYVRELKCSFVDWETRIILESTLNELERLRSISEFSDDENVRANAANDYIKVQLLRKSLESEAKVVFGEQILNFNQEDL
ncbi:hypothetical protein [Vibrio harveyi]|uniref:hypothetical protein n=1 Tax=Vibrio harveyi TaxID=669 RepID=UPI0015583CE8|nr:hypothetical protein [Vibrio harveyi]HDM8150533.1 hypothetical protein [Vibrio harveyi]HDM8193146.1 hypothetical protein [Vibrio harveyi]